MYFAFFNSHRIHDSVCLSVTRQLGIWKSLFLIISCSLPKPFTPFTLSLSSYFSLCLVLLHTQTHTHTHRARYAYRPGCVIDHPSDTQPQWTMAKNYVSPGPQKTRKERVHTVCLRSLVHFYYKVTHFIKMDKTSWTYSIHTCPAFRKI